MYTMLKGRPKRSNCKQKYYIKDLFVAMLDMNGIQDTQ